MNIRASVLGAALLIGGASLADETCNSPYMTGLIKGQEDFIHVWTLGIEGIGDGSDKLETIDVNPKSASYGKPIHSVSVGERAKPTTWDSPTIASTCGPARSTVTRSTYST